MPFVSFRCSAIAGLVTAVASLVHPGPAQALSVLWLCNEGDASASVVTFSANPVFSTGTAEGWWRLDKNDCTNVYLNEYRALSVAIAAKSATGQIVPLKYRLNANTTYIAGAVKSICVPSNGDKVAYSRSRSQAQAPCSAGETAVPVSFAALGGSNDLRVTINVTKRDIANAILAMPADAFALRPEPTPAKKPPAEAQPPKDLSDNKAAWGAMQDHLAALESDLDRIGVQDRTYKWRVFRAIHNRIVAMADIPDDEQITGESFLPSKDRVYAETQSARPSRPTKPLSALELARLAQGVVVPTNIDEENRRKARARIPVAIDAIWTWPAIKRRFLAAEIRARIDKPGMTWVERAERRSWVYMPIYVGAK